MWVALRRNPRPPSLLFTARCTGDGGYAAFSATLESLQSAIARAAPDDLSAVLRAMFATLPDLPVILERRPLALAEHRVASEALLVALRATAVFELVEAVAPPWPADAAALLLLALPGGLWSPLRDEVRRGWLDLLDRDRLAPEIRAEADHIHRQLADLCALAQTAACTRCAAS